jgi:5'-nucleotidase
MGKEQLVALIMVHGRRLPDPTPRQAEFARSLAVSDYAGPLAATHQRALSAKKSHSTVPLNSAPTAALCNGDQLAESPRSKRSRKSYWAAVEHRAEPPAVSATAQLYLWMEFSLKPTRRYGQFATRWPSSDFDFKRTHSIICNPREGLMPLDLSDTLVVGVSATSLFDMTEADSVFRAKFAEDKQTAVAEYRAYMLEREKEPLEDGTAMPLVKSLLALNRYKKEYDTKPLVEVVVMSRNSPETGIRVFNNIRTRGLAISRHAFTGGESVVDYLDAFDVDLFLTTNVKDAQKVIDGQGCAAAIVKRPPEDKPPLPDDQVRIAFDGDAVLFDDSSELVYKFEGLPRFHSVEDSKQDEPMSDGPYAILLRKLSRLQHRLPFGVEFSPVRIAIVTARNAPAEMRVIKTLRHWGVYVNEIFFLGGVEKTKVVKAFRAHIFFDDQDLHLDPAAKHVPSGKVPYKSDSPLNDAPSGSKDRTNMDRDDPEGSSRSILVP